MACEAYKRLEKDWKHAQSEYSYFAHPQNKVLRQMSDRQSKQYAKAAQEKMSDLSRQLTLHQETCGECKGAQL
jgi:hypothetical protein